jgi:hypothetical protein
VPLRKPFKRNGPLKEALKWEKPLASPHFVEAVTVVRMEPVSRKALDVAERPRFVLRRGTMPGGPGEIVMCLR